jgi:hypothetical protein
MPGPEIITTCLVADGGIVTIGQPRTVTMTISDRATTLLSTFAAFFIMASSIGHLNIVMYKL